MTLTSKELAAFGRLGAFAQHARHDARVTTAHARAAAIARFSLAVDPDGKLAPAERARRAEFAKRAHFTKLALKSARVRSGKGERRASTRRPAIEEEATRVDTTDGVRT